MIQPYPRTRTERHRLMRKLNTVARDAPWGPRATMRAVYHLDRLVVLTTGGRFSLRVIDAEDAPRFRPMRPDAALAVMDGEGTYNDGLGD